MICKLSEQLQSIDFLAANEEILLIFNVYAIQIGISLLKSGSVEFVKLAILITIRQFNSISFFKIVVITLL